MIYFLDATPLHYTCQYPVEPEGVEFLCQAGAELNVQDNKTPLHYACEKKSKEKIKILIDYGANIEISDGKKPEDYLTEEEKIWFQSLNHFVLDFQNLLNNKELADMKITTKMGDIYFHKTIIMARLGKDKIEQFEKILHQKEKNEIEKVLKFIYTACIELEFREIVEEIFQELGISFVSKLGLKNLHEDLGKLYEDEESKDFTIIAGEEEIRAHKTILFARSQTFRGMFLSVVDDSNKVNDYRGFSLKALNNIVKFLYFDKFDFDNLSLNVLEEIEEGLDYYGIATSPVLLEQINRKMESLELK
ncbi:ankyrin repeat-containing protein [Anaeramoeba ignava]|uniref:Ankyrin repeat-containing protein n=1 Tax=Anaeramoeba ignava TaxID=1746090 RepID=A0A9Q0RCN3_ANAIG|nr:ankyrin repeat-containing protein [Anaeramoeba ignava]